MDLETLKTTNLEISNARDEYDITERVLKAQETKYAETRKAKQDASYLQNQQLEAALSQFLGDNRITKMRDDKVTFEQIQDLTLKEIAILAEAFSIAYFRVTWSDFLEIQCSDFTDYHTAVAKTARKNLNSLLGL